MKKNKKDEAAVATVAVAPKTAGSGGKANAKPATPATPTKMTIYEYEEKYVKRENVKAARVIMYLLVALIGVIFAWCFFSISKSLYEIHPYAGYGGAAVSVVLFILFYILPYPLKLIGYFTGRHRPESFNRLFHLFTALQIKN